MGDIDQKILVLQENIELSILGTKDSVNDKLDTFEQDLDKLKKKNTEDIDVITENVDQKLENFRENIEVNINVSQKSAEENLEKKINDLEREFSNFSQKSKDDFDIVLKVKEGIESIKVAIEQLRNKEKEDYDIILKLNEEAGG